MISCVMCASVAAGVTALFILAPASAACSEAFYTFEVVLQSSARLPEYSCDLTFTLHV